MVRKHQQQHHGDSRRIKGTAEEASWHAIISQVTWMVCRKFQFQVFNYLDENGKGTLKESDAVQCTRSTAFLVADHLSQLLVNDGMSREDCTQSTVGFGNALWRLHVTLFTSYEDWASHERFRPFVHTASDNMRTHEPVAILTGLLDLATYFCLWTEASTLRHMPESLWFFFWAMQQSLNFRQLVDTLSGDHGHRVWENAFDGSSVGFAQRRFDLRNELNAAIISQRMESRVRIPANIDKHQLPIVDYDNLSLGAPDFHNPKLQVEWAALNGPGKPAGQLSPRDQALLWEMVLFGDGGAFVDRIVTPVFRALAYEISTKGGKGVEAAMRITYDDANECFVLPQNVERIISDVGADPRKQDLFHRLWVLGDGSDGYDTDRATRWYTTGSTKTRSGKVGVPWLVKTFQERRTWFATYLAYHRIFAFHVLWFHLLLALAFAQDPDSTDAGFIGRWALGLSSAVITHAFLEVVYAYGLLYTRLRVPTPPAGQTDIRKQVLKNQSVGGALASLLCCCVPAFVGRCVGLEQERRLTEKEKTASSGSSLWQVSHADGVTRSVYAIGRCTLALLLWMAAFAALMFCFLGQFSWFPWPDTLLVGGKSARDYFVDAWPVIAGLYGSAMAIIWGPLTQRDGYVITGIQVYDWFKSLWRCCAGNQSRTFLSGEYVRSVPPKVGWSQFIRNMLFWLVVIGIKFCIDYLLIISQLPGPIRGLLRQDWLGTCGNDLLIGDSGIPCVENLILVGALCLPVFLVVLFDTGIMYQVVVFAYGCMNGLVNLGLGQVVTWNDLVKQFERGVLQFNRKLLSKQAADVWGNPEKVQQYYQASLVADATAGVQPDAGDTLPRLNDEQTREYQKWTPFADVWDTIVKDLRLSDLISNEEEANLKFHAVHFLKEHGLKPHVLPVCFFAGKIQRALDEGSVDGMSTGVLKEAYLLFLALVTEVGLLSPAAQVVLRHLALVNQPQNYYHNSIRRKMVEGVRDVVKALAQCVPGASKDTIAKELLAKFTALCEDTLIELQYSLLLVTKEQAGVPGQVATVQNLLHADPRQDPGSSLVQDRSSKGGGKLAIIPHSQLDRTLTALCAKDGTDGSADSAHFSGPGHAQGRPVRTRQIRTLVKVLQQAMSLTDRQSEPQNEEASRVLKFFMSTLLNGSMKPPQPLDKMRSLTTLVPHYAEGVIYPLDHDEVAERIGAKVNKGDLGDELVEQMSGLDVSTIDFLRIQFKDEWDNFVQRMIGRYKLQGIVDPERVTERDFRLKYPEARMDLMLWASERGQMLSRTVKGMMMYATALAQLEYIETVDDRGDPDALAKAVEGKYRHIVSSQVYGSKKASKKPADKWLALAVDYQMQKYPALRIAYIDKVNSSVPGSKGTPMSVLLKWNAREEEVEECYRVRLPDQREDGRGVILGEGKPENQNHAMIFCFSESIQTVDMNQENHLAEAFKMRNLLQEFAARHTDYPTGPQIVKTFRKSVNNAQRREPIVALVGFREWIFSGKAGMLGQFAAGAEFAFGTIVQRTMAEPGGARFHYGHPDVWNKLFTMTRGGVSKATRAFHISEDVFGGYNAIFRGAVIKYKEYISVGKARDVGFAQINGFEAKVSGGNGEQSISRDVHRLGTRLDWFRLMSWYHSGIGFFINSTLTMSSVYLAVWLVFLFSLTDSLTVRAGSPDRANALADEGELISTIQTVQLFQLGLLSVIPYWGELCLETGFLEGTMMILRQALSGSFIFFIFRQQTSAYYFTQIVYYGGAKYIATGRGFDLTHTSFVKQFEAFGRSHIYFGFQLGLMAVMLAFLDIPQYALSTWGTWLVAISLTFSPFWFNPATFRVRQVLADFQAWRQWLSGSADPDTKNSWIIFHRSQLEKARNVEGKQTDHGWNRFAGVIMQVFNLVILLALGDRLLRAETETVEDDEGNLIVRDIPGSSRERLIGFALFEFMLLAVIIMLAVSNFVKDQGANARRYISVVAGLSLTGLIIYYSLEVGNGSLGAGLVDIVLLMFANMTLAIVFVQVCLYVAPYQRWSISVVDAGYYAADTLIGIVIFLVLFLLSVVQLVDNLQALLLFSGELLVESQKGAQLRLFDAKRGALGVQTVQQFSDVPGKSGPNVGTTATLATAPTPAASPERVPSGRSPLGQEPLSAAAQARLAAMDVNDYSTVNAQRMQGESQPLVSSVWDPDRARRRAASRGIRGADGSGQGGHSSVAGTFTPQ